MQSSESTQSETKGKKRIQWTEDMDKELMSQVVLYNPWTKGHSWTGLQGRLTDNTLLGPAVVASWKSLFDHTKTLMANRRSQVAKLRQRSGIEEPMPSDYEKALDDACEMAVGAQDEPPEKKKKVEKAEVDVREAAMTTEARKCKPAAAPQRRGSSVFEVLSARLEQEKSRQLAEERKKEDEREERAREKEEERRERQRERDEAQQERRREREEDRNDMERKRKDELALREKELLIRERELNLKDREMALQEKKEQSAAAERSAVMQLLPSMLDIIKQLKDSK